MQNRVRPFFGDRSDIVTVKSSGNQTVTSSRPTCGYDNLSGVTSLAGNRRDPTTQTFTRTQQKDYEGFYFNESLTTIQESRGASVRTFQHLPDLPVTFNELYNEALSKVFEEMRGQVNLAVTAAEAGQVKRMVKNAFKLGQFVRKFHPNQWAKSWLEYQYGWKPLLVDSYNCFEQLMNHRTSQYVRIQVRTKAQLSSQVTYNDTWFPGSRETLTSYGSRRVQIVAEFQPSNSALQRLADFTTLNPMAIAWELVPFSFVFDWWFNLGGYLQNLESAYLYNSQLKRAYVTYGYKNEIYGLIEGARRSGNNFTSCYAKGHCLKTFKSRQPFGLLYPRLPQFELNLGWQRLVSAASLISTQFYGRR